MNTFNQPLNYNPEPNEVQKVEEVLPEETVRLEAAFLVANQARYVVGGVVNFALLAEVLQEYEDSLP